MTTVSLYERLVRAPDGPRAGTTDGAARGVAANRLRQITAHALQSTGDQVVNANTVLRRGDTPPTSRPEVHRPPGRSARVRG